jgi:hypothetical protein
VASIPFGIEFDRIAPDLPPVLNTAAAAGYDAARRRQTMAFLNDFGLGASAALRRPCERPESAHCRRWLTTRLWVKMPHCHHWGEPAGDQWGKVEEWRDGCRSNISVATPFVWRCLTGSARDTVLHICEPRRSSSPWRANSSSPCGGTPPPESSSRGRDEGSTGDDLTPSART